MDAISNWIEVNAYLVYAILFLYCAAKSGALPLFAAIFVSTNDLSLAPVVIASFLGAYLGDELRFFSARRYGAYWIEKWPRFGALIDRGNLLMEKHGHSYIFLYRYPKGMRTIGALPVGFGAMPWRRFTVLNAASALLWVTILVGIGFGFGLGIVSAVETHWGWLSIAALGLFVAVGWSALKNLTVDVPKKD